MIEIKRNIKGLFGVMMLAGFLANGQTVDLSTHIAGTPPTNAVVQWHTSATPSSGTLLSSTIVTATPTSTHYWAFYYSSNNGGCYSPGAKVTVIGNDCTVSETTVDLTALPHSAVPTGADLVWYTTPTHDPGTEAANPAAAENGIYWPVFYSSSNGGCFSPVGDPVIIELTTCSSACYKPGVLTGGSILDSRAGITSLSRAGSDDPDNWPMVRKGGWLVLESKTKAFVPNRVAFSDADNNPATPDVPAGINASNFVEGMIVYDTTNQCLKIYTSTDGGNTYAWYCIGTQTCPD
ncbi:hypothetical protein [Chryseobacterium defluvii]|nr:hypothetical protein [Chryseobacterium defluvii]